VIGVLHVGTLSPRIFTEEDHNLLQLAADRAALAIERARLFEQRRGVEALQRALLPDHLPVIPGIELAARYRPSAVGRTIGGDWYDVFRLGGGRIGLVIGDVMGHGVAAAALMAELRTALRAYALDGHPPAEVTERLNHLLAPRRPTTMTTVAYLVLDPETESVAAVSAGHVPPLLIDPAGEPSYVDLAGDPPIGVSPATTYHQHEFALPTGSTLVLVTDGAIEVRGEPLDRGLERLSALARNERGVDALCAAIGLGHASAGPSNDDVAVLAARVDALPDRLRTSWPAEAEALSAMRHMLRRWLAERGAGQDETYDITVAVQEACANAIEHAYAPGPAAFELDAAYERGVVCVAVRDRGRWRDARGAHRGRGLPLMEALMERVDVHRGDDGTTVVLRRTLGRAPGA
jgi:serine phosphatase RsbU (regulator of sigma subunit)/anti-sigma regulatory factor (Ser/Thr protein kinase)